MMIMMMMMILMMILMMMTAGAGQQGARLPLLHRAHWPRSEAAGCGGYEEDPQEGQHHPRHRQGGLLHRQGGQHVQN